jgi:arylformamidase
VATNWTTLAPDAPADLVPAGYAISGVFDLAPLQHVSQNADLRLNADEARRLSPVHWKIPAGRSFDAVVGALESGEFLRQSRILVDAWRQAGTLTRYQEIPRTNHFTVVDPLGDPDSDMTARVVEMAKQAHAATL